MVNFDAEIAVGAGAVQTVKARYDGLAVLGHALGVDDHEAGRKRAGEVAERVVGVGGGAGRPSGDDVMQADHLRNAGAVRSA